MLHSVRWTDGGNPRNYSVRTVDMNIGIWKRDLPLPSWRAATHKEHYQHAKFLTNQPTNQPAGKPTNQPSNQPTSQPTNQPASQPASQPINQPTNQPANQPTNQSTNQPINQRTNQPTNKPTNQPINQRTNQITNQPTNQPINQPTNQPINQTTNHQPTNYLTRCLRYWEKSRSLNKQVHHYGDDYGFVANCQFKVSGKNTTSIFKVKCR